MLTDRKERKEERERERKRRKTKRERERERNREREEEEKKEIENLVGFARYRVWIVRMVWVELCVEELTAAGQHRRSSGVAADQVREG